jgi:hypothetical protein
MENVIVFYVNLVIWYDLWLFGIVCRHLVYISRLGKFRPKNLATLLSSPREIPDPAHIGQFHLTDFKAN